MLKQALIVSVFAVVISAPAVAGHCPKDAKAIDGALSHMMLSETEKAEIQALRDEGMRLHDNGQHRESEQVLASAMRALLEAKAGMQ